MKLSFSMLRGCIMIFLCQLAVYVHANPIVTGDEASSTLSGKIVDAKTGKPLHGAIVYLHEAKTGAVSDMHGNYTTSSVPAGKYLVEISFEGYSAVIETVDVVNNAAKNFSLRETFAEIDAVTVTGVASAIKIRQSAQPVSIVKRSDWLHTTSTNIIDAVAKMTPGVAGLSTGPAISKPIIRGLGYNRIVTVHDGIRQEGQQWGDEHGIEVDEYSIQKAEILKGPSSLLYGSDAMGGVVHLISNQPIEQGTIKANLLGTFIDNNGLYGGNANIAGHLKTGVNWNLYGTVKSAGDYQNRYDGRVLNSRFRENNIGGYVGVNKSWGYSHLLFSRFNQVVGLVEGTRDSATGQFIALGETPYERVATKEDLTGRSAMYPKQHITHTKVALDNNFSLGVDRLGLTIGYQQNQRRELGDPDKNGVPDLYFDLKTLTYSAQYNWADRNDWKISAGITGMYQQNRNLAEEKLIPEYNQFDIGAFLYTKKTFSNKLTLSGGLRMDHRNLAAQSFVEAGTPKFNALNKSFGNISGSAGLSYHPGEVVTLKLNVARGYRAPVISELASNGAHEGTSRYEYGDNNLKAETSLQIDGGVEVNTPHISLQVNGFHNHIKDYIFYGKLGAAAGGDSSVDVNGEQLTAFTFRQSNAALAGLELRFDVHPHPLDWLHFENSLSLVAGRFDRNVDGSNRLPFMPAPRLQSELRGDFKKAGKGAKNMYIKLEMDNMSRQSKVFTGFDTETVTDGYTLFNIGAGTDITNRKGETLLGIHFSINNIGDIAYQNHMSRLKYTDVNRVTGRAGIFNMGRNFSLKINLPFNWKLK